MFDNINFSSVSVLFIMSLVVFIIGFLIGKYWLAKTSLHSNTKKVIGFLSVIVGITFVLFGILKF